MGRFHKCPPGQSTKPDPREIPIRQRSVKGGRNLRGVSLPRRLSQSANPNASSLPFGHQGIPEPEIRCLPGASNICLAMQMLE